MADMEFVYEGKHRAYQPHVVHGPAVPPPPAAATVGTSVVAPASSPTHAPSLPDVRRPAPLVAPDSHLHVSGLKTLISMCRSNDALIRESHQQRSQRLSTLDGCQREMHTSMGFGTPEPVVYPPLPP
jgi:hypothetical protein